MQMNLPCLLTGTSSYISERCPFETFTKITYLHAPIFSTACTVDRVSTHQAEIASQPVASINLSPHTLLNDRKLATNFLQQLFCRQQTVRLQNVAASGFHGRATRSRGRDGLRVGLARAVCPGVPEVALQPFGDVHWSRGVGGMSKNARENNHTDRWSEYREIGIVKMIRNTWNKAWNSLYHAGLPRSLLSEAPTLRFVIYFEICERRATKSLTETRRGCLDIVEVDAIKMELIVHDTPDKAVWCTPACPPPVSDSTVSGS